MKIKLTKKQQIERIDMILNHTDECSDCGFKAVFMYLDVFGNPLCPTCDKEQIEAYQDQLEEQQPIEVKHAS